jgi:hypothetical protein
VFSVAAARRRVDSVSSVWWRVVGGCGRSGFERVEVQFARQRGHLHVKWYRVLSSARRKEVGRMESM